MKDSKAEVMRKTLISILAGVLSLLLARYSLCLDEIYGIKLVWSVVFSLLVGLAFEWQYSILTVISGLIWIPAVADINPSGVYSVCLAVCFSLWVIFNGFMINKEDLKKPYMVYIKEMIFGLMTAVLLYYIPANLPGVGYNRFIMPGVTLRLNVINYLFTILMLVSVSFIVFEFDVFKKYVLGEEGEKDVLVYKYAGLTVLLSTLFYVFDTIVDNIYASSKGIHLSFIRVNTGGSIKITIFCFFSAVICKKLIVSKRNQLEYESKIESWNRLLETQIDERTRELKNAYDDLESYSYTVSHELKSPLREIEAYIEIIEEDNYEALKEESLNDLRSVKKVCSDTIKLIQQMMDYARVGYTILKPEYIDMYDLIVDCVRELRGENPHRNIIFQTENIEPVIGDAFLIRQAVYNILSNAVKYTAKREYAVVEISSYKKRGTVCFSFNDNGVGFDQNSADKLFEVFGRLHNESDFEGKGVGLATVKKIISRHGGSVSIRGSLDKGCEVYFEIPDLDKAS